jgi:hypothetical protein
VPPDSPLPGFEEAGFDDAALSNAGAHAEGAVGAEAHGEGWPEDDGSYGAEPLPADTPPESAEAVTPAEATAHQAHEEEEPWDPGTSPEFGTIDLGGDDANATALPIPADDPLPGGDDAAWTEPPPTDADPLDLSNLPQTRALKELDGGPAADPLEFDPTHPSPEDLEADLSSPLPASVRLAEDGLEVLGFLDEAAKEIRPRAGRVARYHVRRRSGKVFGPFEPGVIIKMLEDGQLLGSEEVSTDGDAWSGMAAVPSFAQAMQRLVSAPTPASAAQAKPPAAPAVAPPRLDLDQLAQAYGGRMAVVSVVDGEAQAQRWKRWLVLAAAALAVLALLGAGATLHLTRYGAFGFRWLFPAQVSISSAEGKTFAEAKAGLAEDTWPGLRKAHRQLEELLSRRQFPEVRAVWAQSVFLEQRRWGTADPSQLAQATAALEDLKVLPKGNPERLKAEIGQALVAKQPDAALGLIRAAKLDAEGPLLEAEALLRRARRRGRHAARRRGEGRSVGRRLARARAGPPQAEEADKAQADFEAALKISPQHLSSSLELAQLALGRKEPAAVLRRSSRHWPSPGAAPPEGPRPRPPGAALLMQASRGRGGRTEEAVRRTPTASSPRARWPAPTRP